MNRQLFSVVVSWRTRNWRHAQRGERWCKDYGLIPIHKNLYIGNLYFDERNELNQKLLDLFIGKTERYCAFVLCASCARYISTSSAIDKKPWLDSSYEIIQTEDNP